MMIPDMDIIFYFKGDKVDGFCFHPTRPWIFAGDINGLIKVWDYNTWTLIHEFSAHNGSVRSVHLHVSRPLLVSGGTDGKIVVWAYDDMGDSGTSSFILEGHEATVCSVHFHHEHPWTVSAGDDCTVRVWNWLSRNCIAILRHHTGRVTTASFHPTEDVILSACLDGKLCIWDANQISDISFTSMDSVPKSKMKNWICGQLIKWEKDDCLMCVVSTRNKAGLRHAIFHPTLPSICAASEDSCVYSLSTKDSYRSLRSDILYKSSGVSFLAYSAKMNYIMIAQDGKYIALFDPSSRQNGFDIPLYENQYRKLSYISSHPSKNLVALGHPDGFTVCKIWTQSPDFDANEEYIYYVADEVFCFYDYKVKKENRVILPIDDPKYFSNWPTVTSLSCSSKGNAVVICFDNGVRNAATYRLLLLNNDNEYSAAKTVRGAQLKGYGRFAVFVAPDRFVVLRDTSKSLRVTNLENEVVSEIDLPRCCSNLYSDGDGRLVYGFDCRVFMFDIHKSKVVGKLRLGYLEHASWTGDSETVALLLGSALCITDKTFTHHYVVEEESEHIQGGAWDDEHHVFIYKTRHHIKYCLVNGETGELMPYNRPLYITRVLGGTVYCLDFTGEIVGLRIDATEYILKSSVLRKDYMKQCSSLC